MLRIEDIDRVRCRPEFEQTCLRDLQWLGLNWDEGPDVGGMYAPYRQSERLDAYDSILETLQRRNRSYACRCSRAEVRRAQSAPHLHQPGVERPYAGTCRPTQGGVGHALNPERGGWRLNVDALGGQAEVSLKDPWSGHIIEDVRTSCGDFLLGRPGQPSYQLAVVVDDIAMGITDVVRGMDLRGSSARQALLFKELGAHLPTFWHHPLIVDEQGQKLSKRDGATALATLREGGHKPDALIARMGAAVGLWSDSIKRAQATDIAQALGEVLDWTDGEATSIVDLSPESRQDSAHKLSGLD